MAESATLDKSFEYTAPDQAAYLAQIKAILGRALRGSACRVYVFGSRATGTAQPTSDFDLGVLAPEDISRELSVARDLFEESTIPFKVDVVDLQTATPEFRRAAQDQGILLWTN